MGECARRLTESASGRTIAETCEITHPGHMSQPE